MTALNVAVQSSVDKDFKIVRKVFAENFINRKELGVTCYIYYKGKKVVDLWGSVRDKSTGEP